MNKVSLSTIASLLPSVKEDSKLAENPLIDNLSARQTNRIKKLHKIKDECSEQIKIYKKKYKKTKRLDNAIDGAKSFLDASSIALIITGATIFPPLVLVSAGLSGMTFVMSSTQNSINLKSKTESYRQTFLQYGNLVREMSAVLMKNNLSSADYQKYLEEVLDKQSLISDGQLF